MAIILKPHTNKRTISAIPPLSAKQGDEWINEDDLIRSTYINGAWVVLASDAPVHRILPSIGDAYGGGIVYAVDNVTRKVKIVNTSLIDLYPAGLSWQDDNVLIGANSETDGRYNFNLMKNAASEAASILQGHNDVGLNGYSDWFIPTVKLSDDVELILLAAQLLDGWYWSSLELDSGNAWMISIIDGNGTLEEVTPESKQLEHLLIAVREEIIS
ncbi:hypothetical protein TRIP_D300143 [uncultured Paludibacter sp.]|nr:hypothetical protein TRIP_D300143 [uncultured Paludibacter sp.]